MPLSDTGLVVRYYFDEAASGDPATVVDASANNYDLTAAGTNVAANLEYVEASGQRGIDCGSTTGNQRLVHAINNTSDAVRDALHGSTVATIELVVDVDAVNASASRIFGITDRAGGSGTLIVRAAATDTWVFVITTNGGLYQGRTFDGGTAKAVFHLVLDTTQATEADRVKVYKDGVEIAVGVLGPAENETISLASDLDLIAFNRESTGSFDRSFDGILYYAALYNVAFDATRVEDHFDVLTLDDDTPGGGGAATPIRLSTARLMGAGRF